MWSHKAVAIDLASVAALVIVVALVSAAEAVVIAAAAAMVWCTVAASDGVTEDVATRLNVHCRTATHSLVK